MSIVFLIGMPASGKSYWGKTISQYYGWTFVDLDESICSRVGKAITQIFESGGEQAFRKHETDTLKDIISNNGNEKLIVATGGGTILSDENWTLMRNSGCILYLETPLKVLYERLKLDKYKRPLLANNSALEKQLEDIYHHRRQYYQKADYIFKYENTTVINFEEILNKCIDRH